jgi:arylsulfatase A-like enzyme
VPVLRGDSDAHRQVIITGYHEAVDRCVRDQTWSLIQRPPGEPDELYNLIQDPGERVNLIDRYPDEAHRLARSFGGYFRPHSQRGISQTQAKGVQGKYELASGNPATPEERD